MDPAAEPHRQKQFYRSLLWNRSDCLALTVLLGIWGICFTWRAVTHSTNLGPTLAIERARVESVREKIDPNTASIASLRRLPLIGPAKAEAIVTYRKAHRNDRCCVFNSEEDLKKVPGIGPVIVRRVKRYLSVKQAK